MSAEGALFLFGYGFFHERLDPFPDLLDGDGYDVVFRENLSSPNRVDVLDDGVSLASDEDSEQCIDVPVRFEFEGF